MLRWIYLRRKIFWQLHLLSGRQEGEVRCWWVLLLWCIARPVTMLEMLAAKVVNPVSGVVNIGGMRFSMELFRMFDTSPAPGPWFRIIKREDGIITVEQRHVPKYGWFRIIKCEDGIITVEQRHVPKYGKKQKKVIKKTAKK